MVTHKLIRKTCIDMAQALYERLASDDIFYRLNPNRTHWVNSVWPQLIPKARAILAGMLVGDYPSNLKDEISHALILDNQLRTMRGGR